VPDLTQLIALGTIVYTLVNLIRYVFATDWPSIFSQVIAWASGIGATILVAHTPLAAAFTFGKEDLSQIGWFSQLLVGLAASSSISIVYQFKKAVDTQGNAAVPTMKVPKRLRNGLQSQGGQGSGPQPG